jgi:hypothetical protein
MGRFRDIFDTPTTTNRFDQIQLDQALQIPVGRIVNHMKAGATPTISDGTFGENVQHDFFLSFI